MAVLALLLLAASAAPSAHACTKLWGGDSLFQGLGNSISNSAGLPVYDSTSSADGINGFNIKPALAQTYCVAVADNPMTTVQNSVWGTAKLTTALVIAGYGFFTGNRDAKGRVVKMTAADTLSAYTTPSFSWANIKASTGGTSAGLAGLVTGVARGGSSGTTLIIKKFWKKAIGEAGVVISTSSGLVDTTSFENCAVQGKAFRPRVPTSTGNGIFYDGSGATLCTKAAGFNTIVYNQAGLCGLCTEIAVKNAAGVFIQSSSGIAILNQAVPRAFPAATANWEDFDTFFRAGAATPPIVSCEFSFALANYQGAAGGANAKKLYTWFFANYPRLNFTRTSVFAKLPYQYVMAIDATAKIIRP